jgi:hypothetical protein
MVVDDVVPSSLGQNRRHQQKVRQIYSVRVQIDPEGFDSFIFPDAGIADTDDGNFIFGFMENSSLIEHYIFRSSQGYGGKKVTGHQNSAHCIRLSLYFHKNTTIGKEPDKFIPFMRTG